MRRLLPMILIAACSAAAMAWGAHGHRLITYLALDGLPPDMPAWLRDPAVRDRIAFQASEPDRWRGWNSTCLAHENKPDHYLDAELLSEFGLTLETIPHLRNEYLRVLIISKHEHPELVSPYDASKDPDRTKEWPGFVLHAIAEHYAKLQCAFNELRILESANDPSRAAQIEQCRENAIYHMGILSHFVGDVAQPLHTTRHYNGWVGENPNHFTRSDKIHGHLDTGILEKLGVSFKSVRPRMKYDTKINAADPWDDVLEYFRRSFAQVEPVYRLERDGRLDGEEGRALVLDRICDAGAMLEAMYAAAWKSAEPTAKQKSALINYDERKVSDSAGGSSPTDSGAGPGARPANGDSPPGDDPAPASQPVENGSGD